MTYIGEVRLFGGNFAPQGWAFCDGQLLQIYENDALCTLIGTTYGGDGEETFAVPDLRGRLPMGTGAGPGLSPRFLGEAAGVEGVALTREQLPPHSHRLRASQATDGAESPAGRVPAAGGKYAAAPDSTRMDANLIRIRGEGRAHTNVQPYQAVNFIISLFGIFPSESGGGDDPEPYLAEMRHVAFGFAPNGWATCSGQLLPINMNQALFSLLGTTYGGNGQTTFALPDLRGRVPIGRGQGNVLADRALGEIGGAETAPVGEDELPPHRHAVRASGARGSTSSPAGAVPAVGGRYTGDPDDTLMDKSAVNATGGGQQHQNTQPSLALTAIISLFGVYPPRD